jgi:hypothetical protein
MGKASVRTAGGNKYYYYHPMLIGQLAGGSAKVDVSQSLKLNDTFFNATPAQDSSFMEPRVDGSTLTITNHLMAGSITLNVLPGSGLVYDGDLTAIAIFIVANKDDTGGILERIRYVNGKALVRLYYGVTFKSFPHDIDAGNAAPVYSMVLLYSGFVEGATRGAAVRKVLQAVGNANAFEGVFDPLLLAGTLSTVDSAEADRSSPMYVAPANTQSETDAVANDNDATAGTLPDGVAKQG